MSGSGATVPFMDACRTSRSCDGSRLTRRSSCDLSSLRLLIPSFAKARKRWPSTVRAEADEGGGYLLVLPLASWATSSSAELHGGDFVREEAGRADSSTGGSEDAERAVYSFAAATCRGRGARAAAAPAYASAAPTCILQSARSCGGSSELVGIPGDHSLRAPAAVASLPSHVAERSTSCSQVLRSPRRRASCSATTLHAVIPV